jgi:hypothetical protein
MMGTVSSQVTTLIRWRGRYRVGIDIVLYLSFVSHMYYAFAFVSSGGDAWCPTRTLPITDSKRPLAPTKLHRPGGDHPVDKNQLSYA